MDREKAYQFFLDWIENSNPGMKSDKDKLYTWVGIDMVFDPQPKARMIAKAMVEFNAMTVDRIAKRLKNIGGGGSHMQ